MKYLIVGGVAGGATAAARIRRNDESASITLFERGNYISYANCGLPYYIGGTIPDRSRLLLQTPESFSARYAVDVRVGHEVIAINPTERTIKVKEIARGFEYSESYDKLILSPGAEPLRPPLPGIESEGIFTLRNVADTDQIKAWIGKRNIERAVVVGAGFIGLEMAENLHDTGAEVTIVEMAPQVMPPIDFTMAALVHQELWSKNVALKLGSRVERFEPQPEGILVGLHDGSTLTADIVILSIGVKPDIRLAKEAGLQIVKAGGIAVNEYLQTSNPDIYAIGDAIEVRNSITGKPFTPYLAG
ncbi:MAG: FAD/NAD(P)-binding oxidoreductase, partial [Bacteroidales bacterium]